MSNLAVFLEPTSACFDLCCVGRYNKNDVLQFIQNLWQVYKFFSQHNIQLVMSHELKNEYDKYFPYSNSEFNKDPKLRAICNQIKPLSDRIIKFEEDCDCITYLASDDRVDYRCELFKSSTYFAFVNLLGCGFKNEKYDKLLRSNKRSIFKTTSCTIYEEQKKVKKDIKVIIDLCELKESKIVLGNELKMLLKPGTRTFQPQIKSNGNHHTIYKKKIGNIDDIPYPDKRMFKLLFDTQKVAEINLREHETGTYNGEPCIKFIRKEICSDEGFEILYGKLISKHNGGNKGKNAQLVDIKIRKGICDKLVKYCNGVITYNKIKELSTY